MHLEDEDEDCRSTVQLCESSENNDNSSVLTSIDSSRLSVPSSFAENPLSSIKSFSVQSSHLQIPESDTKSSISSSDVPHVNLKDATRVIASAVDAQINSVNDVLNYFSRLIKAEKAVQQALFDLVPDQKDTSASRTNGTNGPGLYKFLPVPNRRRQGSFAGTLPGLGSTDSELNKILQNLVSSTSQQARVFSTRALFHKVVTVAQLESLITCLQCLRRTYLDCESELQSQASQYALNLKTFERKYAKYADHLMQFRGRLTGLCDKRTTHQRKTVESMMNNLENATRRLHLLHNDYLLAIATANHFQQWLHTQLRPCLLNGIERTMQLTCEVVRHLLVFGGETIQDSSPNWLEELQADRNLTVLQQNNVRFPSPVSYNFKSDLLRRVPPGSLSPDSLIFNDLTRQVVVELLNNYRSRELLHRETVDQITRECMQWEEALAQWRVVFAGPLPNPWTNAFNHRRTLGSESITSTASSIVNSSNEDGWFGNGVPDIQDLWHDDRARPVNLCEVSYRLTVCEFELRFASCLAEAHAHLVTQLFQAQSRPYQPSSVDINPTLNVSAADGRLMAGPNVLPDLLDSSARLPLTASPHVNTIAKSESTCFANSTASKSPTSSSQNDVAVQPLFASAGSLSISNRGNSRLWSSFRHSVSRVFTQFSRNGPLRATLTPRTGLTVRSDHLDPSALQDPPKPSVVIDRDCRSNGVVAVPGLNRIITVIQKPGVPDLPPLHSPSSPSSSSCRFDFPGDTLDGTLRPNHRTQENTAVSNPNLEETTQTVVRAADVKKEPWFHGVLPRTEVERLLQNQGDFLVRQTNKRASCRDLVQNGNPLNDDQDTATLMAGSSKPAVLRMVLSVYWNGHKHFILCGGTSSDNGWFLEDGEFPTIRELLEHHMLTQTPVTAKSGACLVTPIVRPDWELDNKDVQLTQKIGQGNFGEVYRGYYNGCEVAVKTCRVDLGATSLRQKFLQGERTALNFCHPHIVKLIGIAAQSYPIMIVMEYVPGGSLLAYLRKSKTTLALNTLLLMVSDAASGMAYLESKNCIHRDLAARNCLVTEAGRLKIADFGMSREEHVYELSDRHGQIPIKWTAPEALATGRYTIKCDVWSYGVLLWEIFTFGDVPYRMWSNPQTREMVESGYRLPAPEIMPPLIRVHMSSCWLTDPDRRPSFADLSQSLHFPLTAESTRRNPLRQSSSSSRLSTIVNDSGSLTQKFSRLSIAVKDNRTRDS